MKKKLTVDAIAEILDCCNRKNSLSTEIPTRAKKKQYSQYQKLVY
jgi:hypothetical protein